jgi:hypothetical protein
MNNEHKKIESLQHKETTNTREKENDSSSLLFKHLGFGKKWQPLESNTPFISNAKP